jgi:LuxR family quorum sensing-dependent transcriptional regulator
MQPEHCGYGDAILSLVEELNRLPSIDAVLDGTLKALRPFGCETLLFGGLPHPEQSFDDVIIAARWPADWAKIYLENRYVHSDPVVRMMRCTNRPFDWSEVVCDPSKDPRGAEVMQRRKDCGFNNGLVVPIYGVTGFAGFVATTGSNVHIPQRAKAVIHVLALYAFDRVRELRVVLPGDKLLLTPRERQVLTWVAKGKSAWEIGEILHIAKRTVDEHVQTTFHKLGAANRAHAVAIALREGMIQI